MLISVDAGADRASVLGLELGSYAPAILDATDASQRKSSIIWRGDSKNKKCLLMPNALSSSGNVNFSKGLYGT